MKRRIIRPDKLNWAIQEWQDGGEEIARGRYAGQEKTAKWKNPNAFFAKLQDAARAMLQDELGDGWTGQGLAEAVEAAETRVTEYVKALLAEQNTDTLIGILQEKGFSVTSGKKGRTSYVDEDEE